MMNSKKYAISVDPVNAHTGNHSIAAFDWRLKSNHTVFFKMNDGRELGVESAVLKGLMSSNPKWKRFVRNEVVDTETGEISTKCVCIYLIPDWVIRKYGA